MRNYAKVSPLFWTGSTGKRLRELGRDAQVVALYLITCPSANMLGLYYLPLPTLCHEIGSPLQGARKALRRVSEAHFAHYDEVSEHVWVPEMAKYQIGESLKPNDNRIPGIKNELEAFRKISFFNNFLERYRSVYHLEKVSPFEAPSKPLRSQEQEQEQEQEQDSKKEEAAADAAAKKKTPPASPRQHQRLTPNQIKTLYNTHCPDLRRCDSMNPSREKMARALATDHDEQWFVETFQRANTAEYCRGVKDGRTWDMTQVLRHYAEIREGKYDEVYRDKGTAEQKHEATRREAAEFVHAVKQAREARRT